MRDDNLGDLPEPIRAGIVEWRERLKSTDCLKVVCETDETWTTLSRLDASGSPVLTGRERFQIHSWMTPSMSWMVVFAYEPGQDGELVVSLERPVYQQLWEAGSGLVRERQWIVADSGYRVRRSRTDEAFGPESATLECRGCIYATAMGSWLAGGADLSDRSLTVQSVGLLRSAPQVAIVPPDPMAPGVWLDVFEPEHVRDQDADPAMMYRRHDFMRLSRDPGGGAVVSEWRTIVFNAEMKARGGASEITAVRRMEYEFHGSVPPALMDATSEFARQVDEAMSSSAGASAQVQPDAPGVPSVGGP